MGSAPGFRGSSRSRAVPKPGVRMTSRIVTVGLVCASLYAAALGAGAVAQDQENTPGQASAQAPAETPTPRASPTATASPKLGVDRTRGSKRKAPNRASGSSETCPEHGELVGTVIDASTSTSARGCGPVAEEHADAHGHDHDHDPAATDTPAPTHLANGTPTPANPSYALATPGPVPIGVPNFFIEKFRIPPFLLPIYQAAGIQYGVRWEVLAAINEIETDYGRNLNISSAGALGWMQF